MSNWSITHTGAKAGLAAGLDAKKAAALALLPVNRQTEAEAQMDLAISMVAGFTQGLETVAGLSGVVGGAVYNRVTVSGNANPSHAQTATHRPDSLTIEIQALRAAAGGDTTDLNADILID